MAARVGTKAGRRIVIDQAVAVVVDAVAALRAHVAGAGGIGGTGVAALVVVLEAVAARIMRVVNLAVAVVVHPICTLGDLAVSARACRALDAHVARTAGERLVGGVASLPVRDMARNGERVDAGLSRRGL